MNCPECDGSLERRGEVLQGEIVPCPHCASELEVMGTEPIRLALAPEVEEDWGE